MAEALTGNRSLLKLSLNINKFGDAGGAALASVLKVNLVLTELNLTICGLGDIKELAQGLKSNRSLLKLDLSENKFGDAGGVALAGALTFNTVLTELYLNKCELTDIKPLADSLKGNRSLLKLSLIGNEFDPGGGVALAGALTVNTVLTELNLNECELTDIKELAEGLKSNRSLSKLSLNINKFGNAGGIALAGAIKVNVALTELDLCECDLTDIKALAESFKSNRSLSRIRLIGNEFGPAGGIALAGALTFNSTLVELDTTCSGIDIKSEKQIDQRIAVNKSLTRQKQQLNQKEKDSKTAGAAPNAARGKTVPVSLPATASATAASSSLTAQTASLDASTVEKLKALPAKHAALAEQVQRLAVLDTKTLQALQGRADQLQSMFEAEAISTANKREKDLISTNPSLQVYYQFFARLLNGTWMACQSISSGMVENAESSKLDYVGQGLDQIGQCIPGIGLATGFLSGVIKGWNYREKKLAVNKMSMLFSDPDVNVAFAQLNQFARQVTLAQKEAISSMPAPTGIIAKIKEGAKDLAALILASDANTPLKRKAEEDCKKLLTAIKEEKLPSQPTLNDLLAIIMGPGFKPQALLPASTALSPKGAASTVAAASPSSPTSDAEVLEQLRKLQLKDAEREAEMQKMREKMAKLEAQQPPDEHVETGNDQTQLQLSKSKQSATTATTAGAVNHPALVEKTAVLEAEIAVLKAKQEEHSDGIDTNKADLAALRKKKNDSCVLA